MPANPQHGQTIHIEHINADEYWPHVCSCMGIELYGELCQDQEGLSRWMAGAGERSAQAKAAADEAEANQR